MGSGKGGNLANCTGSVIVEAGVYFEPHTTSLNPDFLIP